MKFRKLIKNWIKVFFLKKNLRLRSVFNFNFFEEVLYQLIKKKEIITFVQIGANDGIRFDPIYEFIKYNSKNVSGYVLEPIDDYFNDLKNNYKAYPSIVPLNVAIHNELSETIIYKVAKKHESKVPEFALGIASFNKDHHKKTNIPNEYMVSENVKCISMNNLITEYNIENLDVLVIDTEGYDYEILSNIDLNEIEPSVIKFEHGLATSTMTEKEFNSLKEKLNKHDYQLIVDASDVTAIKTMLLNE